MDSVEKKLTTIAENEKKVYEAGESKGIISGIEQGKQAAYNEFWDNFQDYGNRTQYSFAFSADMWSQENFKPKYPIRMVGNQTNVFCYWGQSGSPFMNKKIDFRDVCTIDLSGSTSISALFYSNRCLYALGTLDCSTIKNMINTFSNCTVLEIIEKLILKDDGTQEFTNVFNSCDNLTHLFIEGVIGKNGLNLQWSKKLSHDSIVSIINCLSTTTNGLSITLSKTAVENAFTTEEWTALEQTKPNWTIALV